MTDTDDPFAAIEARAKAQRCEETAAKLLSAARSMLVLSKDASHVFFATLALKLKLLPEWRVQTAATDGKHIFYNPEFISELTEPEVRAVVVHEVMHCANGHFWRIGGREKSKANEAMDLAINPLIRESGMKLPKGALFPGEGPPRYKKLPLGHAFEQYYAMLPDLPSGKQGGADASGDDPGGCGSVVPASDDPAGLAQDKQDWEQMVAEAHDAAKRRGKTPGWLDRMVGEALEAQVDWKEALRDFVMKSAKNEQRWSPPNRRFVGQDIYLPTIRGESIEGLVIAVDTSGSIGQETLNKFAGEIEGICSVCDAKLTIIYCDAQVAHVQEWTPDDGPLALEPRGGGGTSHVPVFEWVEANAEDATCVIALTDLMTEFPDAAPDVPVLWVVVDNAAAEAPFGETIHLED